MGWPINATQASEADHRLFARLDKLLVNGQLETHGVRSLVAYYMPWVYSQVVLYGKTGCVQAMEHTLGLMMAGDLRWANDSWACLTPLGRETLLGYMEVHRIGERAVTAWTTLMVITNMRVGLPANTNPNQWPPYAMDMLRTECQRVEQDLLQHINQRRKLLAH